MASATASSVDNLLLEYEEALELSKTGNVAVFPIFIGTTKDVTAEFSHVDGASASEKQSAYFPFSFGHASLGKFPTIAHSKTGKVIRDTLSQIFSLQGASYFPKAVNHLAKQLRELLYNLEENNANRIRSLVLNFKKVDLPGIYLSRLSLGRLSLAGANFKKALLPFADFEDCVCIEANFSEAFLQAASFKGSNLKDACFDDADCSGCWENNKFKHSIIANPVAIPSRFFRTNFSFAILQNFGASPTNFEKCAFTGATLLGKFLNAKFTSCEMSHVQASDAEFSGVWRSDCNGGIFKSCRFSPLKNIEEIPSANFVNCRFYNCDLHVIPAATFTNCEFSKCSFCTLGSSASVSSLTACKLVECKLVNLKTDCAIIQSKLIDCDISDSEFASLSNCEVRGKALWFSFVVDKVDNLLVGIPPVKYVSEEGMQVNKQQTSISYETLQFDFKKITGLRSSGVLWPKNFPGKSTLENCKFKFNTTKQASDFAARVVGAKTVVKTGKDGEISGEKWENHFPSYVLVNCENENVDESEFLK